MTRIVSGTFVVKACAALVLCAMTAMGVRAQTFITLHNFDGTDGATPESAPIQATDGNLYGTTSGACGGCADAFGTIFKVTPGGTLTSLHTFDFTDGNDPYGGLIQATDGNFYGTTSSGGIEGFFCPEGCGTIFKVTPGGTLTTLSTLVSWGGIGPDAPLLQASDGNFYGTTYTDDGEGNGTIFRMNLSGSVTEQQDFDFDDGAHPMAGLIQATDGNLYGTTSGGGNSNSSCSYGCGTVFKVTPGGTLTTLYSFCAQTNCADGSWPGAGLIQAADGSFYGTTSFGGNTSCSSGSSIGCGTIFKITPSGTLTTLHKFDSTDGQYPGALIQATDGNFYGTTVDGGGNSSSSCENPGCGTVFKITSGGALTTLHSFGYTDGSGPLGLVQDTNGKLYGVTVLGGTSTSCFNGCGTVFELGVDLGPFVKPQPTFGKVGKSILILGTNLTGSTSVTFNGTSATFTVKSVTAIMATVPVGATTGSVQVVTPSGVLSSNVKFRVVP